MKLYVDRPFFILVGCILLRNVYVHCVMYILPEDGHRSGPKHVVVCTIKSSTNKYLLRTVVLIKVLVDTRATGCITQQLNVYVALLNIQLQSQQSIY
jgi:hypothetical protein